MPKNISSVVIKCRVSDEKRQELEKTAALLSVKEGQRVTVSDVLRRREQVGHMLDQYSIYGPSAETCGTIVSHPIFGMVSGSAHFCAALQVAQNSAN